MASKRKRGVIASKQRLIKAMTESGYSTQIALARALAKQENSGTIPKDLVSKAFRGVAISPQNLQRIAAVLNVDAYTLYQTSKETSTVTESSTKEVTFNTPTINHVEPSIDECSPSASADDSNQTHKKMQSAFINKVPRYSILIAIVLCVVFSVSGIVMVTEHDNNTADALLVSDHNGPYTALLSANEEFGSFFDELEERYTGQEDIVMTSLDKPSLEVQPYYFLSRLEADVFFHFSIHHEGRFLSITLKVWTKNGSKTLWSTALSDGQFTLYRQALLDEISASISRFVSGEPAHYKSRFNLGVSELALKNYLEGRARLERTYLDEQAIFSQSRFSSAIRKDENFALAYAGLCDALVAESWSANEKAVLEDASKACEKALELDNKAPYVIAANLALARKTIHSNWPEDTEHNLIDNVSYTSSRLLYEQLVTKYEAVISTRGTDKTLAELYQLSDQIQTMSPQFWQVHHLLSLLAFHRGEVDAAIKHVGRAIELNENEVLMTNLATMFFCSGEVEHAKSLYQQVVQYYPHSHLGYEMLGMAHYFEGEFSKAKSSLLSSISFQSDANIHQIWGRLADTFRQLGDVESAKVNYEKAITIIHQDELLGMGDRDHDVYKLYYEMNLQQGRGTENYSQSFLNRLRELGKEPAGLSASGLVRLAVVAEKTQSNQLATQLLNNALEICPVYAKSPDIMEITTQLSSTTTSS